LIYRLHLYWSKIFILFVLFLTGSGSLASGSNIAPLKQIPDALVSFEPGKDTKYAIVVEIDTQQLILYAYDGSFREVTRMNSSTGKMPGSKSRSGDEKTPEGVYFFTKEYLDRELAPIYGTRALKLHMAAWNEQITKTEGFKWLYSIGKLEHRLFEKIYPIKPNADYRRG